LIDLGVIAIRLEQGGLANLGLANEDERFARSGACTFPQLVDPSLCRSSSDQQG
jgi:hypothetical protein